MSSFSKLFKLFLAVVFLPLIPMMLLLSYYQVHLKDNILETHVNLAEIVAASFSQHIEDLSWRLSFAQNLSQTLSAHKNPQPILQEELESNPDFLMLAVLSSTGKEIYRAGAKIVLNKIPTIDLQNDPTLDQLRKDPRLLVSSFEVEDGRPISEILYPLANGDYLYGIVSFFSFLARVQEQRIGNTGRIYMIAQDGRVLASEHQYTPLFDKTELQNAFASDKHIISHLRSTQETYVGAFAPTPVLGAYVTVLQLKKEAYRSIYHTDIMLALFLITIAALAYFGALTFAEKLGEPIAALTQAAKEVSNGHLEVQVAPNIGWKEFNELIVSFNKMVRDLQDYQQLQIQTKIQQFKDDIFRAIAHDLRSPVLGLQGFLYALEQKDLPKETYQEYIAQMKQAVQNLSELLEDALDVSRVEAGMIRPHKTSLDLQALTRQLINTVQFRANDKKLDLQTDIQVDRLPADEKLFQRVLLNLVSNAIKFTEKGFVKVSAWQDAQHYYVSVQDSGIGMTEQEVQGLFQKYHQIHPEKDGYGLGLFISNQMVQAHGGTLTVSSRPGQGSTFTICLPKEHV